MGKTEAIGATLMTGLLVASGAAIYDKAIVEPENAEIAAQSEALGHQVIEAIDNNPRSIMEVDSHEELERLQTYMAEAGQASSDVVLTPDYVHSGVIKSGDTVVQDSSSEIAKNDLEAKPLDGTHLMLVASIGVKDPGQLERLAGVGPDNKPLFVSSDQEVHEVTMQNPVIDITDHGVSLTSQDGTGQVLRLQLPYKLLLDKLTNGNFLMNKRSIAFPNAIHGNELLGGEKDKTDTAFKEVATALARSLGDRLVVVDSVMGENDSASTRPDIQRVTDSNYAKVIGRIDAARHTSPNAVGAGTVVFHGVTQAEVS